MTDIPETRFANLGEDRIAYQVFGDGDLDLVYLPATGDGIENRWDLPSYATYLHRLAAHTRLIMFDRRGMGSSDPPSERSLPPWELWADDARAVLDTVNSERAVIFGGSDVGPTAILFAASHPTRTRGLILANTSARIAVSPHMQGEISGDTVRSLMDRWGTDGGVDLFAPDAASDPVYRRWSARAQRQALSRRAALELFRAQSMDVRDILASVQVPTLVLHRKDCVIIPSENGRHLAEHIPGARLSLVPGRDLVLFTEPDGLDSIEAFLEGLHETTEPDRALAAILFTDIVASTQKASALGDRAWRNLLESHDVVARTVVEQHRGRLVKTTGDGMLATFDGPGRAIRCAIALGDALRPLGLEIRAGLHTGEIEVMRTDIAGIGVHIAARVLEAASTGEVVVSAAVPMLVAGAGFEFDDRGEHELRGVPGTWKLFAVRA